MLHCTLMADIMMTATNSDNVMYVDDGNDVNVNDVVAARFYVWLFQLIAF